MELFAAEALRRAFPFADQLILNPGLGYLVTKDGENVKEVNIAPLTSEVMYLCPLSYVDQDYWQQQTVHFVLDNGTIPERTVWADGRSSVLEEVHRQGIAASLQYVVLLEGFGNRSDHEVYSATVYYKPEGVSLEELIECRVASYEEQILALLPGQY